MFLSRKSNIFDKLTAQSALILQAARAFHNEAKSNQVDKLCSSLETLEKEGDVFVHDIKTEAEKTFILPLDKEDIVELTHNLDDVVDNLEDAAIMLRIYAVPASNETIGGFSNLVLEAARHIHHGMLMVKDRKLSSGDFISCYKKLHDLESDGDKLYRKALESLMGKKAKNASIVDLLFAIKLKEILGLLEDTLDVCEDIAILFEKLRLKYR
jgi:predicted phosphate transport protein (TIGR00153 family)